jgi:glycerol 2-dehydrogenase (NADP+)
MECPFVKLNTGAEIPLIGFGKLAITRAIFWRSISFLSLSGTWNLGTDEAASAVMYALKEGGYRHIDCALYVDVFLRPATGKINK